MPWVRTCFRGGCRGRGRCRFRRGRRLLGRFADRNRATCQNFPGPGLVGFGTGPLAVDGTPSGTRSAQDRRLRGSGSISRSHCLLSSPRAPHCTTPSVHPERAAVVRHPTVAPARVLTAKRGDHVPTRSSGGSRQKPYCAGDQTRAFSGETARNSLTNDVAATRARPGESGHSLPRAAPGLHPRCRRPTTSAALRHRARYRPRHTNPTD